MKNNKLESMLLWCMGGMVFQSFLAASLTAFASFKMSEPQQLTAALFFVIVAGCARPFSPNGSKNFLGMAVQCLLTVGLASFGMSTITAEAQFLMGILYSVLAAVIIAPQAWEYFHRNDVFLQENGEKKKKRSPIRIRIGADGEMEEGIEE